jgi:NMD protein affecting ribosome stability and mRNA decay
MSEFSRMCCECFSKNTRVQPFDDIGHVVYCPHCGTYTMWDNLLHKNDTNTTQAALPTLHERASIPSTQD